MNFDELSFGFYISLCLITVTVGLGWGWMIMYPCSQMHLHRQTNPFKFSIQSHTVYVNTDDTDDSDDGLSTCALDFVMAMHILIDNILLSVYFQNMKIRNELHWHLL